jgi:hypothetical protein
MKQRKADRWVTRIWQAVFVLLIVLGVCEIYHADHKSKPKVHPDASLSMWLEKMPPLPPGEKFLNLSLNAKNNSDHILVIYDKNNRLVEVLPPKKSIEVYSLVNATLTGCDWISVPK